VILEKGFDAMIGGKDGIRLSGGEKQRIALARAILKNSPILILDEATASSDAENQLEIQKAISSLAQNKTVLTIAHRLSSIVDADKILVFSHGEIVETGIHAELMNKKGSYSRLYKSYLAGRSFHLKGGNSHV
jgi:ATP-binding cassette subfamily B protein